MSNCTDSVESQDLENLLRKLNIPADLGADNGNSRERESDLNSAGALTTEQRSVGQGRQTLDCFAEIYPRGSETLYDVKNTLVTGPVDVVDLAGESSSCDSSDDELVLVRSVPNKKTIPRMLIASSDDEDYYSDNKENDDDASFVDMTQEEEDTAGPFGFDQKLGAELQPGLARHLLTDTINRFEINQMPEYKILTENESEICEKNEVWSVDTLCVALEDVGIGGDPSKQHKQFKENRDQLAKSLYRKYNKAIFSNKLPFSLEITWNKRLMTTAGLTHYKRQLVGDGMMYHARIELSCKVVDTADKLERTLVHEMCHCAAWIIDHVAKPPHGAVFKKWAQQAMQVAPHLDVRTCHQYDIFYAYRWQCTVCLQEIGRHSKSIDIKKKVCGSCKGPLQYLGKFARDGSPSKKRQESEYSRFVQANFSSMKAQLGNQNVTNSDVMKKIAVLWKEKRSDGNL